MSDYRQTILEAQEVLDAFREFHGMQPIKRTEKKRVNYALLAFILVFVVSSCAMVYAN